MIEWFERQRKGGTARSIRGLWIAVVIQGFALAWCLNVVLHLPMTYKYKVEAVIRQDELRGDFRVLKQDFENLKQAYLPSSKLEKKIIGRIMPSALKGRQ